MAVVAASLTGLYEKIGISAECLSLFGGIVAAYWGVKLFLSICDGLKAFFFSKSLGLATNLGKMGEWAVVTGATDGIGLAYAQQLAQRGLNIILISRTQSKLDDSAKEIESKYKVKTKTIAIDFTQNLDIYEKIRKELTGLEVGVLINNVGVSYYFPQFFCEVADDKTIQDIINVNCHSVTMMTRLVLPGMVERRRGVIVNNASASSIYPLPLLSVYSATKAYVDFFSRALDQEYKSKGVVIQSLMPFFVSTKMSRLRANMFIPTATNYVKSALGTIGLQARTFGCISHAVQAYAVERMPMWLYYKISIPGLMATRKKGMKKLQAAAKSE